MSTSMYGRLLPLPFLLVLAAFYGPACTAEINRNSFPEGFIFGASSAAYQYEGGVKDGGRGPSIWDTFTHQHPDKIADRSNGDIAVDSYHRYKEDVEILKDMGMDAYRFSIAWTRILPNGSLSSGINREGVDYYNSLINKLLSKGVQPYVTIFHWDLPQALEDKYGGFLSPSIIDDFKDYAEVCFKEFGDRVKHWITFNEPWTFCSGGYASGTSPPGRCSPWEQGNCSDGNSGTEPYIVAHHQLLAHAETVRLYKEKYQIMQKGDIGITLVSHWFVRYYRDIKINDNGWKHAIDFMFGWFMDPLIKGDYPAIMRSLVGNRLPKFTTEQSKLVNGSFDFIGVNYYTAYYAYMDPTPKGHNVSYNTDSHAKLTGVRNGVPIGPQAASPWLYMYPRGFLKLLMYIKEHYGNPTVYVTENGVDELNKKNLKLHEALQDNHRIWYHHTHLLAMLSAIRQGANVKGYFAWSLLDNFEWGSGYTVRFGLNFVDYSDGLKRYPKKSAHWFKMILQK